MPTGPTGLSKSRVVAGLQCHKRSTEATPSPTASCWPSISGTTPTRRAPSLGGSLALCTAWPASPTGGATCWLIATPSSISPTGSRASPRSRAPLPRGDPRRGTAHPPEIAPLAVAFDRTGRAYAGRSMNGLGESASWATGTEPGFPEVEDTSDDGPTAHRPETLGL